MNEEDVQRRISQGFGQGEGAAYLPWIRKHDFPSLGEAREVAEVKDASEKRLLWRMT